MNEPVEPLILTDVQRKALAFIFNSLRQGEYLSDARLDIMLKVAGQLNIEEIV